jgi:hypothetical protein
MCGRGRVVSWGVRAERGVHGSDDFNADSSQNVIEEAAWQTVVGGTHPQVSQLGGMACRV